MIANANACRRFSLDRRLVSRRFNGMLASKNGNLKLLFVADVPLQNPGSGSERILERQASGACTKGAAVCAIVRLSKKEPAGFKKAGRIKVGQFYANPDQFWQFAYQHLKYPAYFCRKFARHAPFSAVVAHQPFTCFALLATGRILHTPLLYNFHSPAYEEYLLSKDHAHPLLDFFPALARRKIERYCLRHAKSVMVESEYMKQKVSAIHAIADARIFVNPGGVDLDFFHPHADRGRLKKQLGLPAGRIHLLTIRNLERRMGVDNLLKAAAMLKERKCPVHLVIGGAGPERQKLEELIRRYDLAATVTLTGFIPAAQLPQYYGAADLFVLPTRKLEGFGLVTVESLACGTPVMGTPVGGTREILSGFGAEFLFRDATAAAMAEGLQVAVSQWLSDKSRYDRLRVRCREYAAENYSWQRHVQALHSNLVHLIQQRHNPKGVRH